MDQLTISLTKEQANNLLQLLDVAIKAGGYSNLDNRHSG